MAAGREANKDKMDTMRISPCGPHARPQLGIWTCGGPGNSGVAVDEHTEDEYSTTSHIA